MSSEYEAETRRLRLDAADARKALVLAQQRMGKPWAPAWRIMEVVRDEWGIDETPAWLAARLRERERDYGDIERVWLSSRRGAIVPGWATLPR